MPRDLGDVLHYFAPELDPGPEPETRAPATPPAPRSTSVVAVPVGERDVLRATFVWNLTIELARLGCSAALVVARSHRVRTAWPDPGRGPLGSEFVTSFADDLDELAQTARDVAGARHAESDQPGIVLVAVPPEWLRPRPIQAARPDGWLLFTSPDPVDLIETYALTKHVIHGDPSARVGVTVYGVRRVSDAADTFERLAVTAERHLGPRLVSYGLLVDELEVYRAIVQRRPIGLARPQSAAARTLRDVAELLAGDHTTRNHAEA